MIFEKLQEMIAEKLSVEEKDVTMSASFKEDLGADSLDLFEVTMAIEDEFGIAIENEDLESIKRVEDAVNYILARKE